jgi:hypothetical protein
LIFRSTSLAVTIKASETLVALIISAAKLVLVAARALVKALSLVGVIRVNATLLAKEAFRLIGTTPQAIHTAVLGQKHLIGRLFYPFIR